MESIYSQLYTNLGPVFDAKQFLECCYFILNLSHRLVNFIILYAIISGILFENILVNKIFLPLCKNKFWKNNGTPFIESKDGIGFWFNDWLFTRTKIPEDELIEKKLPYSPLKLREEEMFIPFFKWGRYKYKHVRNLYTRKEREDEYESRIPEILKICICWNIFCTLIKIPLVIFGMSLPFRLFVLFCFFTIPKFAWHNFVADAVDTTYLLYEFRTPRIELVMTVLFYVIPTYCFLEPEIKQFIYEVFLPYVRENDPELGIFINKGYRTMYKRINGLAVFWSRVGMECFTIVGVSFMFDNWWTSSILPYVDPQNLFTGNTKKDKFHQEKSAVLEAYRVQNTDKLVAMYPFFVIAIDIFGRYWSKIWRGKLYNLWYDLQDFYDNVNIPYEQDQYTEYTQHFLSLDGTFIEQKISIGSLIYHDFVTFIWEMFSVRTLQTIDGVGIHLSMLCFSWPGMTGFFLAMLYRGLRYRGPDTYPNFSDAVPELPKRTPVFVINPNYFFETVDSSATNLDNLKFIRFLPRCGWRKYFVRWNWTFAFSLSFVNTILYRGIIRPFIGSASWKVISLTPEAMHSFRSFYMDALSYLWIYGFICCMVGISARISGLDHVCGYHVGRFCPIGDRFHELIALGPSELDYFPYDVIHLKRLGQGRHPAQKLTRLKKVKIFVQVTLATFKREFENNIPKLVMLGLVLILFFNTFLNV